MDGCSLMHDEAGHASDMDGDLEAGASTDAVSSVYGVILKQVPATSVLHAAAFAKYYCCMSKLP
jgi:hypothetical protein